MRLREINSPGELTVDPDLIDRFTQAGWQIDGEGQDQLVMSKPGSNTVLKIVGSGSQPRQAEIRRYVNFFRANQRDPHFPRVGADRELSWKGQKYYAYTQERLQNLPGDEAVMDYLEYAMGELGHGEEPDLARVPKGLTVEDIEGLTAAVDHMFESGLGGQYGFDLANLANIMQRSNGQLVIVDPFSGFDDELGEAVNPDTLEQGFEIKRTMKNGLIIRARGRKRYPDMPDVIGLDVEIFDPKHDANLRYPVADTHFKAKQDPNTGEWFLSSLSTGTKEEYRRQGLASAMYNFARALGNELRASRIQSRAGEDFWKKGAAGQGRPLELRPGIDLVAEIDTPSPGVAKQLQTISRPASTSNSDVKSFMSQGYTIKFHPDRLEIFYGGDLVYSRPGNYANPKRHDLATAKARIPQLIRQRLGQTKTFETDVNEVQILSKVKGKGSEPGQLPKFGREITPDQEQRYLGQQVGKLGGYTIWRDWLGGQLSYHLFDPQTRRVVLTSFGSQYKGNANSYIIQGLYALPGNPVKAHQFYRALIRGLGLTLVSDRKQSPGGNRVWQRLEAYPDVEVYGFDTGTGEVMNFGAKDMEMYAVPSRATAGSREMQKTARDIRLVATAR